ncbi:MAG: MoaD/ThiS family protein [Fimbriimonadales bacterium]
MPIPVKLFANLRSRFGDEVEIDLEPPAPVSELQSLLQNCGYWSSGARIALNLAFANSQDTIKEGDEVAVIPAVSGG